MFLSIRIPSPLIKDLKLELGWFEYLCKYWNFSVFLVKHFRSKIFVSQNFIDIDPISTCFGCVSYLCPSQNFIDIDPISTRFGCESYIWPSQNFIDIDPISTCFGCVSYLCPSQNFIDIDPKSTRCWCESYLWPYIDNLLSVSTLVM